MNSFRLALSLLFLIMASLGSANAAAPLPESIKKFQKSIQEYAMESSNILIESTEIMPDGAFLRNVRYTFNGKIFDILDSSSSPSMHIICKRLGYALSNPYVSNMKFKAMEELKVAFTESKVAVVKTSSETPILKDLYCVH